MYNLLIGGAAGQGIDTTAGILEKILKGSGYSVFTSRDYMSRIRGGHNFSLIRFGTEVVRSHSYKLDGIIALNNETVEIHKDQLNQDGFILCDSKLTTEDPKAIKIDIDAMANKLGNPRVSGVIAIGAVLKLFGENTDNVSDVLRTFIKEQYFEINMRALKEGFETVTERFEHLEGKFSDWMILTGSQAIALGSLAAGLKFYSAYPMSPSTAVMEYLADKSVETGIVVEQAEDEIAAINMALGASFAGAKAMTGTSGGGFSLMVEGLGLSGMAEIPIVILEAQRPGPVTGLPTRTEQGDLKFVISASQGEFPRMVIALRNQEDAFTQTIRAFYFAEKYQIPVILLGDQYICDSSATVKPFDISDIEVLHPTEMKEIPGEYLRYRLTENGISQRMLPGRTKNFVIIDSDEHTERGWITESAEVRVAMVDKRMKKLEGLKEEVLEPEFIGQNDFEILLLGWGSTYGPIREALEILDKTHQNKFAALVFGDIYPLPEKLLKMKSGIAKKIINIEQNATGQLASLIRERTCIKCDSSILKYDGRQISGEEIAEKLMEVKL